MTEAEMNEKIERLEAENQVIRKELGRKRFRQSWPDEIVRKYPGLEGVLYDRHSTVRNKRSEYEPVEPTVRDTFSRIIRQTLFDEKVTTKKKNATPIATRDMTDEQYLLYVKALDMIFAALDGCRKEAVERRLNGSAE